MATALETSSQPQASRPPAGLVAASLIGAVYVLASLAVVLYAIPALWEQFVYPSLASNKLFDGFFWVSAELAAIVLLGWFGRSLMGSHPPKGLRGGIFLIVALLATFLLVTLWIGISLEGVFGQVSTAVVAAALIFGAFRFVTSPRGERWMIALEEQGWFHARPFKRVLGIRVRRLTILGILLLGASGAWLLFPADLGGRGVISSDLVIKIPFTQAEGAPEGTLKSFKLLKNADYSIPILTLLLTGWIAYRAVNVPTFAEFLIATEAEMNKVSWTSKRRLAQDTVVVLITTILMALFLLVMDMFWGWLLSKVGVLPPKADKHKEVMEQKW
ncbi:MAG TPA: preprotein translocase subunit SecE [Gemmataceae bacterium]|jgi:preprotein translocase SecE subunit